MNVEFGLAAVNSRPTPNAMSLQSSCRIAASRLGAQSAGVARCDSGGFDGMWVCGVDFRTPHALSKALKYDFAFGLTRFNQPVRFAHIGGVDG